MDPSVAGLSGTLCRFGCRSFDAEPSVGSLISPLVLLIRWVGDFSLFSVPISLYSCLLVGILQGVSVVIIVVSSSAKVAGEMHRGEREAEVEVEVDESERESVVVVVIDWGCFGSMMAVVIVVEDSFIVSMWATVRIVNRGWFLLNFGRSFRK